MDAIAAAAMFEDSNTTLAYHGGQLNGKAVQALMDNADTIFPTAKNLFCEFIDNDMEFPEDQKVDRKKKRSKKRVTATASCLSVLEIYSRFSDVRVENSPTRISMTLRITLRNVRCCGKHLALTGLRNDIL